MNGYIKLFRKLLNWKWYGVPPVKDLFIHLLLKASYKDTHWKGVSIQKGQVVIGLHETAKELGFSVQQIRTALIKLQSTNEITTKSTNTGTIITIINWGDYQDEDNEDNNQNNNQINNQITNEQQTDNKRITSFSTNDLTSKKMLKKGLNKSFLDCNDNEDNNQNNNQEKNSKNQNAEKSTTSKKYKNIRNINNIYKTYDQKISEWFDEFWKLYPRKIAKGKCFNKFKSICKDESLYNKLMEGLKNQIENKFKYTDTQFIPHPFTWLNQERWNDEDSYQKKVDYYGVKKMVLPSGYATEEVPEDEFERWLNSDD